MMPLHAQPARAATLLLLAATLIVASRSAAQDVTSIPTLRNEAHVTRQSAAVYPPTLRDSGVEGQVVLKLRVRENGTVDPASPIVMEATDSAFVQPAMALTREMRFTPARFNGRQIAVWIRHPVPFRIRETPPPGTRPAADYSVTEGPFLLNQGEVSREILARYPTVLRNRRVGGDVVLRFRINEGGTVDSQTITMVMATELTFEEPAMEVVRLMRFSPAKVNGRPVKVFAEIPVQFRMPARGEPPPGRHE